MIFSTGNGQTWLETPCVPGTGLIVADAVPQALHPWTPTVYRRLSYSGATGIGPVAGDNGVIAACVPGSNAAADQLKAPGCRRAYDEVVVSGMGLSLVEWWESVLPAIGSNDGAGPASSVILFVAGNPYSPYVQRFLAAAAANPKVIVIAEGMHYESDGGDRTEEIAWLAKLEGVFPPSRYGLCLTCADKADATDKAYAASGPRARDADEAAIRDWLRSPTNPDGCDYVGYWTAYSTERSRWLAGDALFRAVRVSYGVPT